MEKYFVFADMKGSRMVSEALDFEEAVNFAADMRDSANYMRVVSLSELMDKLRAEDVLRSSNDLNDELNAAESALASIADISDAKAVRATYYAGIELGTNMPRVMVDVDGDVYYKIAIGEWEKL